MITTVLRTSAHLFTPGEANVLVSFLDLSGMSSVQQHRFYSNYSAANAQHLFVYLTIHPKCHRLESLGSVDIPWGDLLCTIEELCCPIADNSSPADSRIEVKSEENVVFPSLRPQPNPFSLCISDSEMTLRQILEYLDPNELDKLRHQLFIERGQKVDTFLKLSLSPQVACTIISLTNFYREWN
jgi:hypothetical protein